MKKFFAAIVMLVSYSVFAASNNYVPIDGLTPEQVNQLKIQALQMANSANNNFPSGTTATVVNVSESMRTEAQKWGALGTNMGTAMVSMAKEIGVATNEFVATPLGKMTAAVIIYKVIGRDLLKMATGALIVVMGYIVPLIVWFKMAPIEKTYENIPRIGGLWISRKVVSISRPRGEDVAGWVLIALALLIVGNAVGLNMMF